MRRSIDEMIVYMMGRYPNKGRGGALDILSIYRGEALAEDRINDVEFYQAVIDGIKKRKGGGQGV
jgi:hypothetical protein